MPKEGGRVMKKDDGDVRERQQEHERAMTAQPQRGGLQAMGGKKGW